MLLYHGSGFYTHELKPAFQITGKLVKWDKTESNKYLYATKDRAEAINQAFASQIEHHYTLNRYQSHDDDIRITLKAKRRPSAAQLARFKIWLYTINYTTRDGWELVYNKVNGLEGEYRTEKVISANIHHIETIDLKEWLEDKSIEVALELFKEFKEPVPFWARW